VTASIVHRTSSAGSPPAASRPTTAARRRHAWPGDLGYDDLFAREATHAFDRTSPDGQVVTADELARTTADARLQMAGDHGSKR
jgi:hypothetical protein